jgi:hypothetical protein
MTMLKNRTRTIASTVLVLLTASSCFAASLGTAARSVIPVQVQQIINVDYRRMKNSDSAMQMKEKLLPPNMKQFEDALKGIGVVPDRDLDQITLAVFRAKDNTLQIIGVAQGQFPRKKLLTGLSKQKIKGNKINGSLVYPMSGGMYMTFLDDWTMLFGPQNAVQAALDARDNSSQSLNANGAITEMIQGVDQGTVWSVLDSEGTQNMLKSALGTASDLAEFGNVKSRLLGSHYSMDFDHGVDFNLSVITSDNITAASLSAVMKAGLLFKKSSATAVERAAIDGTTVDSQAGQLTVRFKADDKNFQSLLDSPMFSAVTR